MAWKFMKIIVGGSCLCALGIVLYLFYGQQSHAVTIDMQNIFSKQNIVPVLVVGSGCAGYSAALYVARGKIQIIVLAGGQPGGQLSRTTKVENWPGLIDQLGPDIMQKLQKQAESFGAEVVYDAVKEFDGSQWPYKVVTYNGTVLYALTIIVATGASPAMLNIPGELEYLGRGVTTCAICDAPFHKGSDVVIIGGGDSAAEEALQVAPYAKNVTILVRKEAMRASAAMQDHVKAVENIKIVYNTEVTQVVGDDTHGVTGVQLYNNVTKEATSMSVTGVFLAIGHTPNSKMFEKFLEVDAAGYILTKGKSQETSMPGIFAAGDIEDKIYRQAGVAAGSGIRAGLDALAFLRNYGFNAAMEKKIESNLFDSTKATSGEIKEGEAHVDNIVLQIKSKEEFEALREREHIVVADLYTHNCPGCLYMMPAYEAVARTLAKQAVFVKIDAEALSELADAYKISRVPTILLFKDGVLVDRRTEVLSAKDLTAFVQLVM
jgi:thioredoxin reductase (NADPH)